MKKTIVVYQPSKVGSTTVMYHMLKHYNLSREMGIWCPSDNNNYPIEEAPIDIFHTHTLDDTPIGLREKILGDDEIYFICLTREPMSRNISGFFEPKQYHPRTGIVVDSISDKDLKRFGIEFKTTFNQLGGISWFDTEFLNMGFGDLYSMSFNREDGYSIYSKNNKKLLLIRMENINGKLNEALTKFMGEDFNGDIFVENSSVNRNYKENYRMFKNTIDIPKSMLDAVYNTKHTNFFYTKDEIENFYKKWGKIV